MAKPTWIKLDLNIFDNTKIKMMRQMPLIGDYVIEMWVYLLTRAGRANDDGAIYLDRNLPYTEEMISIDSGIDQTTVKLLIEKFQEFGMLEQQDDGVLAIADWEEHQNVEGLSRMKEQSRLSSQRYRDRKKKEKAMLETIGELGVTSRVTSRDGTEENREEKNRTEEITSSSNNQLNNTKQLTDAVSSVAEQFEYNVTPTILEGIGDRMLKPMLEAGVKPDDLVAMMSEALKTTELNGKHSINYAGGIVKRWMQSQVLTPEDVISHRNEVRSTGNQQLLEDSNHVNIPTDVDILNTDWSQFK